MGNDKNEKKIKSAEKAIDSWLWTIDDSEKNYKRI